jgi:peptidoglycan/xylan/chitin deacetylase (PgdA/CDA1 family)
MFLKHPIKILLFSSISLMVISLFLPSVSNADTSCRCVAFTLDGIQDYFLTNVQMDIIKTFDQKDANLTIGIIGNDFGLDTNMTSFIQNEIKSGIKKSVIEVANNGWKGEDYLTLSKDQQLDLIKRTQARINFLLKIQPFTFIAPYGNMNNDTIPSLAASGLRYATGYWETSDIPVRLNDSNLYIIPPSISTGVLNPKSDLYEPLPYDQLVEGIRQNITDNGVSVVSMQPLEFAQRNQTDYINQSNQDEIKDLGSLLDELRNMNVTTVTITGLSETVS